MLGVLVLIGNLGPARGEDEKYVYVKVQFPHGGEEHWLLTDGDLAGGKTRWKGLIRAGISPRGQPLGHVCFMRDGAGIEINTMELRWKHRRRTRQGLVLTDADLERIRQRVERNAEDIEAHHESWLTDLLD